MNDILNIVEDLYGPEMVQKINACFVDVKNNINVFKTLGINDIYEIFCRLPYIFVQSSDVFEKKIYKLINKLGSDYISIIEEDILILEEML